MTLYQPDTFQLRQGVAYGGGSAVNQLRNLRVDEGQIPPPMLIHVTLAVHRHVQQDSIDLFRNQPQVHPQQKPGINQVGRQGGGAGDVVSFHVHSPFRVGFHVPSRKIL